jgi:hypothetical protein
MRVSEQKQSFIRLVNRIENKNANQVKPAEQMLEAYK